MIKKLLTLAIVGCGVVCAQTPVKTVDGGYNERVGASAGQEFVVFLTAVPQSSTIVSDGTTTLNGLANAKALVKVQLIYCTNSTAGALTLSFSDNQGSPSTYATTISIAANSVAGIYSSSIGLALKNGMKWTASGSGLSCQVQGVQ